MELSAKACVCHVQGVRSIKGSPRGVGGAIGFLWFDISVLPLLAAGEPSSSSISLRDLVESGAWLHPGFWLVGAIFGFLVYATVIKFFVFAYRGHSLKCCFRRFALGFAFL
jgi:hypothetical protein